MVALSRVRTIGKGYGAVFACLGLIPACAKAPSVAPTLTKERVPESIVACGTDVVLPIGRSVLSSTLVGDDLTQGSCLRGRAPECVYMLDVPARSDVRLSLESADFDGALVLMDKARGRELICVDDSPAGDTHHARIETTLAQGRYAVVVESGDRDAGQFSLFAEVDVLPAAAEACAAAQTLVPGVSLRGSTRGAANGFEASCAGGAVGPERVHSFDLAARSRVRLVQRGEYESALYLRSQCDQVDSEVLCNDDLRDGRPAVVTAELEPGRYFVYVDSYARGQSGDYVLSLEQASVPSASAASACALAGARELTAGEHEIDTLYAASALEGSCGGSAAPEVLYRLPLAEEITVQIELLEPEFDAAIYVRLLCDDERSELTCIPMPKPEPDDDESRIFTATLGPGVYTVGVDGLIPSEMGAARLRVAFAPLSVPVGVRLP